MKCNSCHRTATHFLKLGFAQKKREDGKPRFTISFETDGGFCRECAGRTERQAREGLFLEIVGAETRQEVETMFLLRGWGVVEWNDTSVEFIELANQGNALKSAPAGKMVS